MEKVRGASWVMVVAVTMGVGCGGTAGPAFEPVREPTVRYQAGAAALRVIDQRRNVEKSRSFDTVWVSHPGLREGRELPLAADASQMLKVKLRGLLSPTHPGGLLFEVKVEKAEAGYRATWWSEVAFSRARITVCVWNAQSRTLVTSGMSESWAEVSSLDVGDEEPAELLDVALEHAWMRWVGDDSIIRTANEALAAQRSGAQGTSSWQCGSSPSAPRAPRW